MATISAEKFLEGGTAKVITSAEKEVPTEQETGFLGGIKEDLMKRSENLGTTFEKQVAGEQNIGSTALQTLGQGAGFGLDITNRVFSALTPDVIEKPVSEALGGVAKALMGTKTAQGFTESYSKWKQENPEAARNLEATGNIAAFLPIGLSAAKAAEKVPALAGKAVDFGKGAVSKVGQAVSPVAKYAESRVPKGLSIFTGESDDVVRHALNDPNVARTALQNGDQALRKAVEDGGRRSIKIQENAILAQRQAFQKLVGNYGEKQLLNRNVLLRPLKTALENKKVNIGKGGVLDFTSSPIVANPGEITKIQAAYRAALAWDDFSLGGINEYKQLIGKLTKFATEAGIPSKSPTLGNYYHSIDSLIKTKLPSNLSKRYAVMNAKFSKSIDLIDDMVNAFNSGDPFTRLANALGKNKDTLRHIVEFYEKKSGKKVLPIVAGRELAMEKTAAFGFLNPRSWIDFFISPEVQAKIVLKTGEKFYKP